MQQQPMSVRRGRLLSTPKTAVLRACLLGVRMRRNAHYSSCFMHAWQAQHAHSVSWSSTTAQSAQRNESTNSDRTRFVLEQSNRRRHLPTSQKRGAKQTMSLCCLCHWTNQSCSGIKIMRHHRNLNCKMPSCKERNFKLRNNPGAVCH